MSLIISNISTNYLKNITFEVKKGEIFCLGGPIGAGKSTLLNIIVGLDSPLEGRIYLDNKDITEIPPYKRGVKLLFQNHILFPNLNVKDNILFPLNNKKSIKSLKDKFNYIISLFHLEKILDKYPFQLSGGEYQKVILASILIQSPKALLLDEPMNSLDTWTTYVIKKEIKKIKNILNIPIIFVTHDPFLILSMGDKVGIIIDGKLLQIGLPEEIYNSPKFINVAKFLGNPPINLIEGYFKDGYFFNDSLPPMKLLKKPFPVDKKGILGIRPENIKLNNSEESIKAKIDFIENIGFGFLVYLKIKDLSLISLLFESLNGLKNNNWVNITFDMNKVNYF